MPVCDVCGNDYDKTIEVSVTGGAGGTFDSFECAIHALATTCNHCGCRIIGHGVQSGEAIFCCVHCARQTGEQSLSDRA